ncbi:unnamed protein product [Polarella glacialis]|uniref:Uncharacterized protein n=1 Tax=Polarella glacialis TaxID=89957 RepID=A0A813HAN9_POLGL|nr:unnamed protein product [Polarella glacialis]CAE8634758.1 unnamed protein product [Polarella glacialis]CAE8723105.1 unnamed protein product [Polarella glacialis]
MVLLIGKMTEIEENQDNTGRPPEDGSCSSGPTTPVGNGGSTSSAVAGAVVAKASEGGAALSPGCVGEDAASSCSTEKEDVATKPPLLSPEEEEQPPAGEEIPSSLAARQARVFFAKGQQRVQWDYTAVPACTRFLRGEWSFHQFRGEWDAEGVYFYQAYRDAIADHAVEDQRFGGPHWNPARMTWIKPSFGWVLYRSGYAMKSGQTRVLKVKLGHDVVAELLSECHCRTSGGGTLGRVQWDPEKSMRAADDDGREPRTLLHNVKAIQIGLKGRLSHLYVASALSIEDVTPLVRRVHTAQLHALDVQKQVNRKKTKRHQHGVGGLLLSEGMMMMMRRRRRRTPLSRIIILPLAPPLPPC